MMVPKIAESTKNNQMENGIVGGLFLRVSAR
jgi:hypothetical protein